MELVEPSILYKESFIAAIEEYQAQETGDRQNSYYRELEELRYAFPSYISRLLSESQGKHLPDGFVPQTTYWLVEGDEFVGRVSIRHILNKQLEKEGGHIGFDIRPSKRKKGYGKKILELALPKALELGLAKVLITCNDNNEASIKIIKANKGVFQDKLKMGGGRPSKLRFWVQLKKEE